MAEVKSSRMAQKNRCICLKYLKVHQKILLLVSDDSKNENFILIFEYKIELNQKETSDCHSILKIEIDGENNQNYDSSLDLQNFNFLVDYQERHLVIYNSNIILYTKLEYLMNNKNTIPNEEGKVHLKLLSNYFNQIPTPIYKQVILSPYDQNLLLFINSENLFSIYSLDDEEYLFSYILFPVNSFSFLSRLNPEEINSFAFGNQIGWNKYTIFFISSSDRIYALSPIVPRKGVIDLKEFKTLIKNTKGEYTKLKIGKELETAETIETIETIETLETIETIETLIKTNGKLIKGNKYSYSLERSEFPIPRLQGTLNLSKQNKESNAYNILHLKIIESNPMGIIIITSKGTCDFYITFESVLPAFSGKNLTSELIEGEDPIESLNIELIKISTINIRQDEIKKNLSILYFFPLILKSSFFAFYDSKIFLINFGELIIHLTEANIFKIELIKDCEKRILNEVGYFLPGVGKIVAFEMVAPYMVILEQAATEIECYSLNLKNSLLILNENRSLHDILHNDPYIASNIYLGSIPQILVKPSFVNKYVSQNLNININKNTNNNNSKEYDQMQLFFTMFENVIKRPNFTELINSQSKILNNMNNKMKDDQIQIEKKGTELEQIWQKNLQEEMKIRKQNEKIRMKLSEIYSKIVVRLPKVDKTLGSQCQNLEEILSKLNEWENLFNNNKSKMEKNQVVYQIMKSFQNPKNSVEIDRIYTNVVELQKSIKK